ncbi:MAG: ribonuclease PH [Candidatus Omnitrophica bacterium]|nr:ribonuclease PH [Candidatus Omnitrophota bacterium]MBU1127875.1 ribonuclease PH [Candidatus Omnitrophota bacterium]MBU1784242.1 ribonuclease PH [Candidatus Omnitrophota bacterium]MBU1851995.1 ribonuclease PH [Candidatus Omnitrophota bacterium]
MRQDGRLANGTRKIKITPNFIKYAEGSCLIEMGDTRVVCTASVENGVPRFLRGQGTGWITAEYGMLPASCQGRVSREATSGKKTGRTHEIQRLIGRSMRLACDMNLLGEKTIWLDADVLQADGGTRCASITGSFVALALALNKLKKNGDIDVMTLKHFIAAISVGIVGGKACLDLTYEEDARAEVDMNVIMTDLDKFVEVQGTAEGAAFSKDDMDKMLELARAGIGRLMKVQKEILEKTIGFQSLDKGKL